LPYFPLIVESVGTTCVTALTFTLLTPFENVSLFGRGVATRSLS